MDGHKLLYHLDEVVKWQEGELLYPLHLDVGPSGDCSNRCIHCYLKWYGRKKQSLEKDVFLKLMRDIGPLGVKSIFIAGSGEPLLNQHTPEAIEIAKQHGVDVSVATNGHFFSKETAEKVIDSLSWVRFSIQAASKALYPKVHGTREENWEKVFKNLETLVALRSKRKAEVVIGVLTCLIPENISEVYELASKCKEIGVDYITIRPISQNIRNRYTLNSLFKGAEDTLKKSEALSNNHFKAIIRYNLFNDEQHKEYKRCYGISFISQIDADGGVYTCGSYLGKKHHCYGNLYKQPFEDIWKSERTRRTINYIHNQLDFKECDTLCRPHNINKFLWSLKNPPEHVNFI